MAWPNQAANAAATGTDSSSAGTPPAIKARSHRVKATVWDQTAGNGDTFQTVQFTSLYKPDGADQWAESPSFSVSQLTELIRVATQLRDELDPVIVERRDEQA